MSLFIDIQQWVDVLFMADVQVFYFIAGIPNFYPSGGVMAVNILVY